MLNPANLFRMMTEMIFVLLGGFLVWLGLTNRFMFQSAQPGVAGAGSGADLLGRAYVDENARAARTSDRTVARVGGASLVLVGFLMLGLVVRGISLGGTCALAVAVPFLRYAGSLAAVLSLRTD